jgi:hypothetical protein
LRLLYASKNQAFLIISYSLRFKALVGVEGRAVERIDEAIISYYIVYFFTDRDFDDIRLILVTRETAQPLVGVFFDFRYFSVTHETVHPLVVTCNS